MSKSRPRVSPAEVKAAETALIHDIQDRTLGALARQGWSVEAIERFAQAVKKCASGDPQTTVDDFVLVGLFLGKRWTIEAVKE